jgi:hypothetical protein
VIELEIPRAALAMMLREVADNWQLGDDEDLIGTVRKIAIPVVAAELRRIADELGVIRAEMRAADGRNIRSSAIGDAIRVLDARAVELERQP